MPGIQSAVFQAGGLVCGFIFGAPQTVQHFKIFGEAEEADMKGAGGEADLVIMFGPVGFPAGPHVIEAIRQPDPHIVIGPVAEGDGIFGEPLFADLPEFPGVGAEVPSHDGGVGHFLVAFLVDQPSDVHGIHLLCVGIFCVLQARWPEISSGETLPVGV